VTITFDNVSFYYNKGNAIFDSLNFTVGIPEASKGRIVALMGASGCGKSTLLKLILKVEQVSKGRIIVQPSQPVIAYLPQEPVLFEHLSPMKNAMYFSSATSYKKRFDLKVFKSLAGYLNMESVLEKHSVLQLSGGEKQRLSLLRALSIRPDILLLDEPTTGLDADVKLQFLNKLREIVLYQNLLVIYVTHQKIETEVIADEIVYLHRKNHTTAISNIFHQPVSDFKKSPPVIEALKIFSYPRINFLKFEMIGEEISVAKRGSDSFFYLRVEDENIVFSVVQGSPFKIVSRNSLYCLIEIGDTGQLLSVDNDLVRNDDKYMRIYFMGRVHQYNGEGVYEKELNIITL